MSPLQKIRKLKPFETFMEIAQSQFQFSISCYWLCLESREVVSQEQIQETLTILFRNMDILHLCIRQEQNGEFGFYKMAEERTLLKVLRNQSLDELDQFFERQTQTSFDSERGPLWRATYVINDVTDKEMDIFTSHILFSFNHAIVDGFTAFTVCNSFLKVLNDVIGGRVQKSYYFGELDDGSEMEELVKKRKDLFEKNPEYFNERKFFFAEAEGQKIRYNEFFPVSKDMKIGTKYIHGEIDEGTNKKIQKVFKSNGVSFHSGVSAVANWALMELFMENGLTDEQIDLPSEHAVNLRRYFRKSSTIQLGSHPAIIKMLTKTDRNVGANFWEYARELNKMLNFELENMQGIDALMQYEGLEMNFAEILETYPPPRAYYCTTNMGNISSILTSRGDHVSIKWFRRGASCHNLKIAIAPFFQTFEGRLVYTVAYATQIVSNDTVNQFVDKIINKLKILSNL